MSENKKYFYMKVKDDFYDSNEIIALESLPDGVLYSNILMKMYLRSLKQEGKLMINDYIPMDSITLSQVVRQPQGVVEKAIDLFKNLKLIDVLDDGAIYMLNIQNYIGKSTTEADRKRAYRLRIEQEKQKILEEGQMSHNLLEEGQMSGQMSKEGKNVNIPSISNINTFEEEGQMSDNRPPKIELEIELEREFDTLHYTNIYIIKCFEKIIQTKDKDLKSLLEQCSLISFNLNSDQIVNEIEFIKKNNYLLLMIYSLSEIYKSSDKPLMYKLNYSVLSNLFKKTEENLGIKIIGENPDIQEIDENYDFKRFLDYYIKSIKNELENK